MVSGRSHDSRSVDRFDACFNRHVLFLFHQGLDENDFDAVAGHLVGTLEKLGLEKEQIDEVVGVVGPLRGIFEGKN